MSEQPRHRGELEREIMRILWDASAPIDGKEIQSQFQAPVPAYTTLLTTLDRLERKNLVGRSGSNGRKILFQATYSEEERVSSSMLDALQTAADRDAVLLRFAGNLSEEDVALLRAALPKKRPQD
ncbi:MAG: BlaI/MecI/CopY family transcriptional regulator [Microbacteriaceae bacterium]